MKNQYILQLITMLGGGYIGLSIPIENIIITNSYLLDFLIFFPIGIILLSYSFYYNFLKKKH